MAIIKQRLKYIGAIVFMIFAIATIEFTAYHHSTIPVTGEVLKVWESKGKHSSTLMLDVRFDYGIETVNANGRRYMDYQKGDVFTNSCHYTPVIGCSGLAYTGSANTIYSNYIFIFIAFEMTLLTVLTIYSIPMFIRHIKYAKAGKIVLLYKSSIFSVRMPNHEQVYLVNKTISDFNQKGYAVAYVSDRTVSKTLLSHVKQNAISNVDVEIYFDGIRQSV